MLVGLLAVTAIGAPLLSPYDPVKIDTSALLLPPSLAHPFGTDNLGRDLLSRVFYGGQVSLFAGLSVVGMASVLGTLLGTFSGYIGGRIDELVMRTGDMFLSFPSLVLAMAIVAALGPGLNNALVAMAIVWWPSYARLVRGQVLSVRETAYIEAARSLGASHVRIVLGHILPNSLAPILIQMTSDVGRAILTTASLSFVGLGARPPSPEWGALIAGGRQFILDQWWYPTFPGLAIFVTVLGFGLLGDGLRDVLDPRLRR